MRSKGVFVTTYFSFKDPLMQAYTLPYVKIMRKYIDQKYPIYLLSIEKSHQELSNEQKQHAISALQQEGIQLISLQYHTFGWGLLRWIPTLLRILSILIFKPISTIHAWCTPGGVIGLIMATLTGKKLVLDSFEPHAEVMAETQTWSYHSLQFRILFHFEKRMARKSKIQICCTEGMKNYALEKYQVALSNPMVKPACVDLDAFAWKNRKNPELMAELNLVGKVVCVYAGKFGGLYLESEVFDYFKVAYDEIGDKFRILLLTNDSDEKIRNWRNAAGLPEHVIIKRFVPHQLVADYIGLGDFAIAPYQPVPSRNYGAPIKVSEYWALGLPVVITPNIADDSKLIEENKIGSVLKGLDTESYITSIREISNLLETRTSKELYDLIRPFSEKLRTFKLADLVYRKIYYKN